jgi:hypothetical protein
MPYKPAAPVPALVPITEPATGDLGISNPKNVKATVLGKTPVTVTQTAILASVSSEVEQTDGDS